MNKTEMKEKIQDLESQLQDLKDALENTDCEIQKGQLCWFWDDSIPYKIVGIYNRKTSNGNHLSELSVYRNARPITPEEVRDMYNSRGLL